MKRFELPRYSSRPWQRGHSHGAFTEVFEHLGDRWSLVILRDLTLHGTRGFDALADSMVAFVEAVTAWVARRQVTPTASPALPEGQPVRLPDGTAGMVVMA